MSLPARLHHDHTIASYSVLVGFLYAVMVLATWLIFRGEGMTVSGAFAGSVVYVFYLVIVFGAVILGSVVAVLLKRERDLGAHQ